MNDLMRIENVLERLGGSENVCDIRKARDIEELVSLGRDGAWTGRFDVLGAGSGADRTLVLLCRMGVAGLVWRDSAPVLCDGFDFFLSVPHVYPLSMPAVRFTGGARVPFNPHVVHSGFLPEPRGLPPELHEYLRRPGGDGHACYLVGSQWASDGTRSLAVVAWQLSRILTGTRVRGEEVCLNATARDFYLRLAERGELPIGRALPLPAGPSGSNAVTAGVVEEPDITWERGK